MGLVFDCQVEPNYKQFEISKEISCANTKNEKNIEKKEKSKKIEKKFNKRKIGENGQKIQNRKN